MSDLHASRPSILLVDDIPTNLEVLAGALEHDYDLSFALSGPEALELIKHNPPDLILLDVMMPDMSGFEVHRILRENPLTRDLPVIFVTADASESSELIGLNQGADDYLVKPIQGPVLNARVRNLLARYQLEKSLRDSEETFSTLAGVAPVAILRLDDTLDCAYVNPLWTAMTGLSQDQSLGSEWLSMLHPQDRPLITEQLLNCLGTTVGFKREFRIISLTKMFWVYGQAAPIQHQSNTEKPGLILTLTDITDRKAIEATLQEQEQQLEILISSMDDVVITLDTSSCIKTFHCPPKNFGFGTAESYIGCDYSQTLPTPLSTALQEVVPLLMADPSPISREFTLDTPAQGKHHFNAIFSPLLNGSGWPTGFLCVARDITERKEMEQELARLATTDTLTGVANRRRFIDQAEIELRRFHRFNTPVALLMLDLDHFKQVNDTYGHAAGDAVLCHLSRLAETRLRGSDLFGRLGGEEFSILLPGTDLEGAADFAEQFRQCVASSPANTTSGDIPFSLSIGVSIFMPEDSSVESVFARADEALYRAKNTGRNRVEIHNA
ncbi:MAG TPA: diguanylate cyclase [Rhodocyclaceae bacterium]|jgi:diguanylate cyclase (GGDEF)-like protein/PAS domain S-box-containing protein